MARNLLADDVTPSAPARRNLLADEVPQPSPRPIEPAARPSFEDQAPEFDVAKIPESTAYGGVAGVFAPEILRYGGKALQPIPQTRPLGLGMEIAGEALRGRRLASAVSGAVSGGVGETATQLATSLGAPAPVAYGAGIVSSIAAPTLIGQLATRTPWLSGLMRDAEEKGFTEAGQRFAQRLRGKGVAAESRGAQEQVVSALEEEAKVIRAAGQRRADQIMADAEAQIARLAPGAEAQANQIRENARSQAAQIISRADQIIQQRQGALREVAQRQRFGEQLRVPEGTRRLIGQPREATDVGQSLRDRITQVQRDRLTARTTQANADKDAVRAEVDAKQAQGEFVENLPEYKELLNEIKAKAGIGLKEPLKAERDPGTVAALKNLYKSLKQRQVESIRTVKDPKTGEMKQEAFSENIPTGFDSVDTIRRRLGEAYRNPQAEGYGAIGQNLAKDYYTRLSQILGKYSDAKKQFISNYEELSRELDIFKGAAGRKATAVDRYNPEQFVTDPASLPGNYFSTRTAVQDLIELTGGDRKFVESQASSFVARQLEGVRTPQAAADFEARNRDWLREFPNLEASVNRYIQSLGFAETRGRRLTEAAKAIGADIKDLPIRARKEAADVTKAAEEQAKGLLGTKERIGAQASKTAAQERSAAAAQARMLERSPKQDQVKYFDSLVTSGDTKALEAAAPIIKRNPETLDNFVQGVRITLSRMAPDEVSDNYRRLVRPALESGGLATKQQLQQIDRQIQLIESTARPEMRPTLIVNAIKNGITGALGMSSSRLMESLGLSFANPLLGVEDATR